MAIHSFRAFRMWNSTGCGKECTASAGIPALHSSATISSAPSGAHRVSNFRYALYVAHAAMASKHPIAPHLAARMRACACVRVFQSARSDEAFMDLTRPVATAAHAHTPLALIANGCCFTKLLTALIFICLKDAARRTRFQKFVSGDLHPACDRCVVL